MAADPNISKHLKAVDLFAGLSDRNLKRVVEAGRAVTHNPAHVVIAEGSGSLAFHLILEGTAQVDVSGSQREALSPGAYFGELALLDGKPRSATITAGPEGLTAFVLDGSDFSRLLEAHPEMNRPIIEGLCARLREERAGRS